MVEVGVGVQAFWAVWDRVGRRLVERTALGRRGVRLGEPGTPVTVARVHCRGLVDDSAGYHARRTDWRWCAGVGTTTDGQAVTWNLASGVHDADPETERAVWRGGVPVRAGAMSMSDELDRVTTVDGGDLRFRAEAVRERDDRVLGGLIRGEYVQPFGTFGGTLPGRLELATGFGVLERHRARW